LQVRVRNDREFAVEYVKIFVNSTVLANKAIKAQCRFNNTTIAFVIPVKSTFWSCCLAEGYSARM